ncbi:MAG: hypothetical protein Q4D50_00365 [Eubacteriales bacterium]|nr:hypothetical protein [Eubacteriales bacterium]
MAYYLYEDELLMGVLSGLLTGIPSMLFGIAAYVLTSLGLYTIARRRGLNRPWLAWIPVVNCWILGSLSDQYHYVVKGENKSKRKSLLILSIITLVLSVMITVLAVGLLFQVFTGTAGRLRETELMEMVMGPVVGILGLCLPLCGVAIAYAIIRYMALYDVYKSLDPDNCVLYLVLSILIGVTEPFFLFFNRNKDLGMPPRQETAYIPPQQNSRESWENENKDYL